MLCRFHAGDSIDDNQTPKFCRDAHYFPFRRTLHSLGDQLEKLFRMLVRMQHHAKEFRTNSVQQPRVFASGRRDSPVGAQGPRGLRAGAAQLVRSSIAELPR